MVVTMLVVIITLLNSTKMFTSDYIVTDQFYMVPYSPQLLQHLFVDFRMMAILTAGRWYLFKIRFFIFFQVNVKTMDCLSLWASHI